MASDPITSWQTDGETMETVRDFILRGGPKSLEMVMAACQAPPSMGFPRLEYWSGLPFPSPRDLPDPGIEPVSPALAGGFSTTEPSRKPT